MSVRHIRGSAQDYREHRYTRAKYVFEADLRRVVAIDEQSSTSRRRRRLLSSARRRRPARPRLAPADRG